MQKKDASKFEIIEIKNGQKVCPYTKLKCIKTNSPISLCSSINGNDISFLCPKRFNIELILKRISSLVSKSVSIIKEFKVANNFIDYLIVDNNNHKNYLAVEIQSLDTCGSIKSGSKKHVSINWKATIKTIMFQIFEKSYIFNSKGKKIVLVCQEQLIDYLLLNYCFKPRELNMLNDIYIYVESKNDNGSYRFLSINRNELINIFSFLSPLDIDQRVEASFNNAKPLSLD